MNPMRFRIRRRVLYEWLGVAAAILIAVTLAVRNEWLWRIDQTLYDASLRLWERKPAPDVVIVGVDEASLAKLGRWPWPRELHARMVERLTQAGAKAIAFDMVFAEPGTPSEDAAFARAIEKSARVVLPVYMSSTGNDPVIKPIPALAAYARLAHAHIELDRDGMARSLYLREGLGRAEYPHLSAALVLAARGENAPLPGMRRPDTPAEPDAWIRDHWLHIPFAGPPGHFPTVAYVDVLENRVEDAFFRDRMVLVGAIAPGMLDSYPTPVSGNTRSMPGVEISAHAIDAILRDANIATISPVARLTLSLVLLAMPLCSLLLLTPRPAFLLSLGTALLVLATAMLLARWPGLWFPPAVPVLGAMLAYPLWSWRRLEATQRFLETELEAMNRINEEMPLAPSRRWREIGDPIERRIEAVRAASANLRSAQRFVADVVDNLPQAAVVMDEAGHVMLGNQKAAALFRESDAAALRGRHMNDLLATFRTASDLPLAQALAGDHVSIEAKSGRDAAFLVTAAPLIDDDGRSLGRIVSLTDITELNNAQRRRDEYMSYLSHDMRSPQVSILALLEIAQIAPQRAPKNLNERIENYARKTLELADGLVHLGRAEEKNVAEFQPVELDAVLNDAVEEQSALAAKKNIAISVHPMETPMRVSGDRQLLTRALSNLLSNAVKYSDEGKPIECRLETSADGRECTLIIADQGRGMAAEDLPRLFDRFTRFDAPGGTRVGGAGLGMAFVKTVLDKHEAQVETTSSLGVGTTFRIRMNRITGTD